MGMSGCSGGAIVLSVDGSSSGGVSGCSVSGVGFWPAELEAILGVACAECLLFATVVVGVGSVARGALAITGWYRRRNFVILRVILPDPYTLTTY